MCKLPKWVTNDDIKGWLTADGLVADSVKVIWSDETGESKGCAFIETSTEDAMNAIIQRFHQAPLEDRLLHCEVGQYSAGRQNG